MRFGVLLFTVLGVAAGCSPNDGMPSEDATDGASTGSTSAPGSTGGTKGEPSCVRDDTPVPNLEAVVFVNFDGVTLELGRGDDPAANATSNLELATTEVFDPVEDDSGRDCVVEAARHDLNRFGVWITDVRPEAGDYTMVIVSPTVKPDGAIIAERDCANSDGPSIVAVSSRGPLHPESQAGLISQGVAISFGLDRVQRPGAIMDEMGHVDDDPAFVDECLLLADQPQCPSSHGAFCPPGRQNSVAELLALEVSP